MNSEVFFKIVKLILFSNFQQIIMSNQKSNLNSIIKFKMSITPIFCNWTQNSFKEKRFSTISYLKYFLSKVVTYDNSLAIYF